MNVIVVGGKGLPERVAETLRRRGDAVTFVEPPEEFEPGDVRHVVPTVTGDPTAMATLEQAGVRSADALVVCTRSDEQNLVISFLAKRRFAVPTVVARVNDPANTWLFDESWGVDVAVDPSEVFVSMIGRAAEAPRS